MEHQYHSNLDAHALVLETKEEVLRSLLKQNASIIMQRSTMTRERDVLQAKVDELVTALKALKLAGFGNGDIYGGGGGGEGGGGEGEGGGGERDGGGRSPNKRSSSITGGGGGGGGEAEDFSGSGSGRGKIQVARRVSNPQTMRGGGKGPKTPTKQGVVNKKTTLSTA